MTRSTEEVLNHHLSAFGDGDLEGILSDYGEDSLLMTPQEVLRGRGQMKPVFEALLTEFAKPGASFAMHRQTVEGEIAFIVWSAETADNVYELGTDTFVVRDGKIVAQSFTGKITPKG